MHVTRAHLAPNYRRRSFHQPTYTTQREFTESIFAAERANAGHAISSAMRATAACAAKPISNHLSTKGRKLRFGGVVRLRLARYGRKHKPHYRIVACDPKCKRDGKHLEQLGTYSPIPDAHGHKHLRLKEMRIKYWLSVGAQPSETVARLLGVAGLLPPPPYRPRPIKMIPRRERREDFSTVAAARGAGGIGSARGMAPGSNAWARRPTGTPCACYRPPQPAATFGTRSAALASVENGGPVAAPPSAGAARGMLASLMAVGLFSALPQSSAGKGVV